MKLMTALAFIALGAILRFAVTADLSWIDIQTLGVIVMLVGLVGLLLPLYRRLLAATRRRRERLGLAIPTLEGEEPDSMVIIEEIDSAHQLASQARPFLEAEGYSDRRIDELALVFAANNVGWKTEEFIDWALTQGRLGPDPNVDA